MKLHNTLTRHIEELKPLDNNTVKLYTCGLTVYSQPHIGNWVGYIYWDVLKRTLEATGYTVEHVQNITDVGHLVSDDDNGEDKMEKGARVENMTAWEVAEKYSSIAEHEAYDILKLKKPKLARATDFIEEQIDAVKILEKKDYTYIIPDEGVYFDTAKLSDYGKLARLDTEGLQAGSRVVFKNKRNVTDFALWKFSPQNSKRDMEWDSPWGTGFPGWHLECSVIAQTTLGEQIDIHTGGVDHIPIHHTNEIAQSEALTGKQFSQIWLHNNHLKVNGGKMAKSIGNIYTLGDIEKHGFDVMAFKLMILSKNYHTEGNFTWDILSASQNRLDNWYGVAALTWQLNENPTDPTSDLTQSLSDNLDTPKALKIIDEYFDSCQAHNTAPNKKFLAHINTLLGINLSQADITKEQKQLIKDREQARETKNWKKSDEIRDVLARQGIVLRDDKDTQIWTRKNTQT